VWIDCVSPTDADLERLDRLMGFEVPNRHDIAEIELSSRLYREDDGSLVMVANLLPKTEYSVTHPRPAAFILRENLLLTIRYSEFFSFERVSQRLPREAEPQNAMSIFCRLLEEAVADRADNLEMSMRLMEELTSRLFIKPYHPHDVDKTSQAPELDVALRQIGSMGEAVSNIRESITSLQRAANYARTYVPESWWRDQRMVLDSIKSDLTALSDEAAFIMNKLSFNLDAVLGMINMDESKIIRLLSVVTLLLSPPTLIAGIYGMNFSLMPELNWKLGYVFALALMATTAIVSILYLKRKRWM
jgi:Mg2+ and Co2+ transporters